MFLPELSLIRYYEPLEFKFDQTIKVKNGIHSKLEDHEVNSPEVIEIVMMK